MANNSLILILSLQNWTGCGDRTGKMATTASMRKVMIGLVLLMGLGVMVVYWNQDDVRPIALIQTVRCEEAKVPVTQVDQT